MFYNNGVVLAILKKQPAKIVELDTFASAGGNVADLH
jgi:hypothetical protein